MAYIKYFSEILHKAKSQSVIIYKDKNNYIWVNVVSLIVSFKNIGLSKLESSFSYVYLKLVDRIFLRLVNVRQELGIRKYRIGFNKSI